MFPDERYILKIQKIYPWLKAPPHQQEKVQISIFISESVTQMMVNLTAKVFF